MAADDIDVVVKPLDVEKVGVNSVDVTDTTAGVITVPVNTCMLGEEAVVPIELVVTPAVVFRVRAN